MKADRYRGLPLDGGYSPWRKVPDRWKIDLMKPGPSSFVLFKKLLFCLGSVPLLLLTGCDQQKAEIEDRKDVTLDIIENQKDAVEEAAEQANEIAEASAEAAKTRIAAETEAANAHLDAEKVKAEARADAATAEIDAERAQADADKVKAETAADVERARREVGISPGNANAPSDPASR